MAEGTDGSGIPQGPEPEYDRVLSGYQTFAHEKPFHCEWGGSLSRFDLAYETWGN